MDWLQFWSSIISSVAWPVCAVIISLIFRKKLSDLLAKLLKVELPGGISAEFGKALAQVEEAVVSSPESASDRLAPATSTNARVELRGAGAAAEIGNVEATGNADSEQSPVDSESNSARSRIGAEAIAADNSIALSALIDMMNEANAHPTGVVMEAWKELETSIVRLATESLEAGKIRSFNIFNIAGAVSKLKEAGVLSGAEELAIQELRRLRNLAAHSSSALDPAVARNFARQARNLRLSIAERLVGRD